MKNRTQSYLMFITSMLIFGTIGVFRRYIPVSSGILACARGLIGALSLVIVALCGKRSVFSRISVGLFLRFALIGALIGINWILLFEAYNYTTIATATLCYYMEPTIVILAAPVFLKEKLTIKKFICALVAIIGMMFVSGFFDGANSGNSDIKGVLLGLGAAAFYSAVVILSKKTEECDTYQKTAIQLFFAAVIMLPYLAFTEKIDGIADGMTSLSLVMVLVVGFVHTGLAYALYFAGMKGISAQTTALLSYIDPVAALLLSAIILSEKMSIYGAVGAVLIIGAALAAEINIKNNRKRR